MGHASTRPCPELTPQLTSAHALHAWPAHLPLAALVSGGTHPLSRWSLLTLPDSCIPISSARDLPNPNLDVDPKRPNDPNHPWFEGGWMVQLDYELGNRIEPGPRFRENPGPLGLAFRTRWGLARDEVTSNWWEFGERPSSIDLADLLKEAGPERRLWRLSRLQSEIGQDRFEAWVARAIEYIRAGDIFQVNLAHHMQGDFVGSARELAAALLRASKPMYGAYLETPPGPGARSVISLSPERFLSLSPGGVLRARPMKGTRPIHADPRELDASPKDRAELDMIIDLMRNDLGRVARLGSVNVTTQRVIEPHGRVWQASAEVEGVLRPGLGVRDVIEATFPPGSITGAPKYRAREIIDELEPRPRGPYCGCIGAITSTGAAEFSVAIRTLTIDGESSAPGTFRHARASYPVGAGIVVDSSPRGEWEETLHKAAGVEDC